MKLGAFSISLNIKDIKASKQFYETLGFIQFAGDIEKNILTFNLGWDESANKVDPFDDVRTIQKHLKDNRLKLESEADEKHFWSNKYGHVRSRWEYHTYRSACVIKTQ